MALDTSGQPKLGPWMSASGAVTDEGKINVIQDWLIPVDF